VVLHGIDYNMDGLYSFSDEGASELDPSLPAEATDPVACGVTNSDDEVRPATARPVGAG